MTLDEKIVEAASRAYCKVIGLAYDDLSPVLAAKRDEAMRAAITAYQAEAWQPIETAPKEPLTNYGEGPTILLFGGFSGGSVRTGYWKAVRTNAWCDMHLGRTPLTPTHWQPLPPAPKASP